MPPAPFHCLRYTRTRHPLKARVLEPTPCRCHLLIISTYEPSSYARLPGHSWCWRWGWCRTSPLLPLLSETGGRRMVSLEPCVIDGQTHCSFFEVRGSWMGRNATGLRRSPQYLHQLACDSLFPPCPCRFFTIFIWSFTTRPLGGEECSVAWGAPGRGIWSHTREIGHQTLMWGGVRASTRRESRSSRGHLTSFCWATWRIVMLAVESDSMK